MQINRLTPPAPADARHPSTIAQRLQAGAAAVFMVAISCGVFLLGPHNEKWLQAVYGNLAFSFTGAQFLVTVCAGYSAALLASSIALVDPDTSKSLRCVRVVMRLLRSPRVTLSTPLPRDEKVALLATLLKMFFAPLMAMQLLIFCMGAWGNGYTLLKMGLESNSFRSMFDRFGFWLVMQVILFIDVLVFTVGYLVESRRLGNQIRSVDATWLGWGAVLLCYPPFNLVTGMIFGSATSEFPKFTDTTLHLTMNLLLLVLMAIYASASVSLGWKASNLTHRGIIARGPYAIVRHPAYTCKNLAWWIGAVPLVMAAFDQSVTLGLQALASVIATTMLYALRAVTEEDHLRSVDGEYAEYAARVRWRFIPGVC